MITLLTPTRNRPQAFILAEQWVHRQTYPEPVQWIVVNDGQEPYDYTMDQTVVTRNPRPGEGHSLAENLLEGLKYVQGSQVVILEDDDWISPHYLMEVENALRKYPLVGYSPSRHYNVHYKKYRVRYTDHCNLGSTCFRKDFIPAFRKILEEKAAAGSFTIDMSFWKRYGFTGHKLTNEVYHVGLKGLPGEVGLGMGHRDGGTQDLAEMPKLSEWIGHNDAKIVRDIVNGQ